MSPHPTDTYYSLATVSEGSYREKGSKFYAHAYPVATEDAIKEHLNTLRQQYHDARHHCYAFVLKPLEGQADRFRANDDGEPSHSAGDPILGQIRSLSLHDVLVVVVRYFGGTKLGVGGLVNAYKTAAAQALAHNQVVTKVYQEELAIQFDYAATSAVQQVLHRYATDITEQRFTQHCYYQLRVPRSQTSLVRHQLGAIPGVDIT